MRLVSRPAFLLPVLLPGCGGSSGAAAPGEPEQPLELLAVHCDAQSRLYVYAY